MFITSVGNQLVLALNDYRCLQSSRSTSPQSWRSATTTRGTRLAVSNNYPGHMPLTQRHVNHKFELCPVRQALQPSWQTMSPGEVHSTKYSNVPNKMDNTWYNH